jgi:hypothetical protein
LRFLKINEVNTCYNVLFYLGTITEKGIFSLDPDKGNYMLSFEEEDNIKNYGIKRDTNEKNWVSLNLTYFTNNQVKNISNQGI